MNALMGALFVCGATALIGCSDDDGGGPVCGNNVIEGQETCDGSDLGGETCASQGFSSGTLACNADCSDFDTSGCSDDLCGNGVIDAGEDCDGDELGGTTCQDMGFAGGELSCDNSCSYDVSACEAPDYLCSYDETIVMAAGNVEALSVDTANEDDTVDLSCEEENLGSADRLIGITVAGAGDLVVTTPGSWHIFALFPEPAQEADCFASGDEMGCHDPYFDGAYAVFSGLSAGNYYLVVSDYSSDQSAPLDYTVAFYGAGSEVCNNGVDDDGDGDVDCDDDDCTNNTYCAEEICDNGIDDNADGYVDCLDRDCVGSAECTGGICTVDTDFGIITSGETYDATIDTSTESDDVSLSCNTSDGGDHVFGFSLEWPATVTATLTQSVDNANYLGFFYEGPSGSDCLDQEATCLEVAIEADTPGQLTLPVAPLSPGNYFLILEGAGAGSQINVSLSVSLNCPEGRHEENNDCVWDTCASLNCEEMNMECDDSSVPAVCSGCLSGYEPGYGRCILPDTTYGDPCEQDGDCPGTGSVGGNVACNPTTGGACISFNTPECATAGQPCTDDPDSMCVYLQSLFGDYYICMEGCTDDSDCRPGYWCNPDVYGSGTQACDAIADCSDYGCNDGATMRCEENPNAPGGGMCWLDACASDPCSGVANSTGDCENNEDGYACVCDATHAWNMETEACDIAFSCGAIDLGTLGGTMLTDSVDTCAGASAYGSETLGCTGFAAAGNERVFSVTVPAGETMIARMTPQAGNDQDSAFYVLTRCNDVSGLTCQAGADNTGGGETETVSWTNDSGSDQTVYLIADAYSTGTCGMIDIEVETAVCDAVDLGTWNGTAIQETVDSCTGTTSYGNSSVSCTGWGASGEEIVYSLTVPDGETINVTQTPTGANDQDSSLYILTDCFDFGGTTCVAGADETMDGEAETTSWTNNTGSEVTVYIVADAFSGCGEIQLDIDP
jgi:hypothetical protein